VSVVDMCLFLSSAERVTTCSTSATSLLVRFVVNVLVESLVTEYNCHVHHSVQEASALNWRAVIYCYPCRL